MNHVGLFKTKLVHLTSHPTGVQHFGNQENYSTFTCSLNNPPAMHYNRKVAPVSVSIPNVFDNIDHNNNTLIVSFNNLANELVDIPTGFYTTSQLATALQTAFNSFLQGKGLPLTNVVVQQNSSTSKLEVTSPDYVFTIHALTDLAYIAGITSNMSGGGNGTAVSAAITPNVNTKPIILVHSNLSENNSLHSSGKESHLLCVADFSQTQRGAVKTFAAEDLHQWEVNYTSHQDLRTWHFQLTDANLQPVYLPTNCRIDIVLKVISTETA